MKRNDLPANDRIPDHKALKRDVKEVWQALRLERRTRGKSLASADIEAASLVLRSLAEALQALAQTARTLENTEPTPSPENKSGRDAREDARPKRRTKRN